MSQFIFRRLAVEDKPQFLNLLKQLTVVGEINDQDFTHRYRTISENPLYHIYVLEDIETSKLVGTGTLLIEEKFIHALGKVGHIEDIVIGEEYRKYGLGKRLINELTTVGKQQGCYKIILDCKEELATFYEKCGFKRSGVCMRLDV